jgi:ElaB/YqjD/DUF883 family membrane-anchored ribosome-binding protein
MFQTRESITEKVAALENQVVGTVQTAANTLTDTVEAVKSIVTHAPETVSDTVKQATEAVREALDITGCIRRNPWAAVGTTMLAGGIVGWLTGRSSDHRMSELHVAAPAAATMPTAASPPSADTRPGMFDDLIGMLGEKVKELARTALESVSGAVKENIQSAVPKLVGEATDRLTSPEPEESHLAGRFDARRARM